MAHFDSVYFYPPYFSLPSVLMMGGTVCQFSRFLPLILKNQHLTLQNSLLIRRRTGEIIVTTIFCVFLL